MYAKNTEKVFPLKLLGGIVRVSAEMGWPCFCCDWRMSLFSLRFMWFLL